MNDTLPPITYNTDQIMHVFVCGVCLFVQRFAHILRVLDTVQWKIMYIVHSTFVSTFVWVYLLCMRVD